MRGRDARDAVGAGSGRGGCGIPNSNLSKLFGVSMDKQFEYYGVEHENMDAIETDLANYANANGLDSECQKTLRSCLRIQGRYTAAGVTALLLHLDRSVLTCGWNIENVSAFCTTKALQWASTKRKHVEASKQVEEDLGQAASSSQTQSKLQTETREETSKKLRRIHTAMVSQSRRNSHTGHIKIRPGPMATKAKARPKSSQCKREWGDASQKGHGVIVMEPSC